MLGKLGYDTTTQTCEYRTPGDGDSYVWLWVCWLAWMVAACAYCGFVVVRTILSLRTKAGILDRIHSPQQRQHTIRKDIRRLIVRVSLYCVIPVLTQMWFVVFKVHWHHTQSLSKPLVYLSVVGSGTPRNQTDPKDLPGILNLLALFLDPAFANAIRAIRKGPKYPERPICAFSVSQGSCFTHTLSEPCKRMDRPLLLFGVDRPSPDLPQHLSSSTAEEQITSFVRSL